VVAYDLSSVIDLLPELSQPDIVDFTHFVLHRYLHHTVEGFYPQRLADRINHFDHQTHAISAMYRLLRFPTLFEEGKRVITKHHDTTMWVAYLDDYYTPDGN